MSCGYDEKQSFSTSIEEIDPVNFQTKVYPNPVRETSFTIDIPESFGKNAQMRIIDLANGKEILQKRTGFGTHSVSVENLTSGTYLVQIMDDVKIETHKLILLN